MQAVRRRRDAQAWREVLARFAQSGLAVVAFCRRERISQASFYRWRTLFGRPERDSPRAVSTAGAAPDFVDLGTLAPGVGVELRLDLGGGVLLHLIRR